MMKKIITGVMVLFVTATIAVFATSITPTHASPLLADPTPTPVIDYWTGSRQTFSWDRTAGDDVCWSEGGWVEEVDTWGGSCPEIVAPDDNYPAGILVTLNSKTFDGDARITHGTNTNFAKKFTDSGWGDPVMSVGETICIGSSDGCTSQGYSVDSNSDWEGYTAGTPNTINSMFTDTQLGYSGGVNYSVTPIWYGVFDCESVEPEDREFISTGLLLGPDEVGETFELVAGEEYVLQTGGGPWNDGVDDSYEVAVRFQSGPGGETPDAWGEWAEMGTLESESFCSDDFLDANGAYFMFVADEDEQVEIQFRVNDVEDEFDDNIGDIEYYWMTGEGSGQDCADQWTDGNKVAGRTIAGANPSWVELSDPVHGYRGGNYNGIVAPGGSYLYKVTGTYLDDGVESYATSVRPGLYGTEYTDPNNVFLSSVDQCDSETNDYVTYYGIVKDTFADDTGLLVGSYPWGTVTDSYPLDNSGTVVAEWYDATWTAPASDCATKYTRGTFIESPIFFADSENGKMYPQQTNGFVVGQVYYLESQGTPYSKDGEDSWDFMVKNGALLDPWETPDAFFDCITPIDQNRYGYYWTALSENIELRASTSLFGDHDDNEGTVKFNLYGAIPNDVPAGEDCGDYYSMDILRWRDTFDADENTGYPIDFSVFTPGTKYAIKLTGAFTEPDGDGKSAEIRRSAHGMSTPEWEDMEDWTGALCYEEDATGFDIVYFEATVGADYEIRANTPIGNTGSLTFEVWELNQEKLTVLGCENNYNEIDAWYVVKQNDPINANNPGVETDGDGNVTAITGYVMANEFTEEDATFKIELGYMTLTPPQWDLQVSDDGGETWVFLEDWVECWVDLGQPEGRGYFTTPVSGGPFLLRVYDVGGVYLNNVGGVEFSMWIDDIQQDPGDVWENPTYGDVLAWGEGCYAKCVRPGLLQVGEWAEYARCRFARWIAWCPAQAQAMESMRLAFTEVEPFKTFYELLELVPLIRSEVDSYSWNADSGGTGDEYLVESPPNYIFMPGEGGGAGVDPGAITGPDSIWGTGEIDLTPDDYVSFRTECDTELSDSVGPRMALSMCFAFNVMDQLGIKLWFQIIWDILMFVALILYIKKNWVDPLSG